MRRRSHGSFLPAVLGASSALLAAVLAPPQLAAQAAAPATDAPPALVTVIGASVSSGFVDFITGTGTAERNQTVPLWNALQPLWAKGVRVRSRSVMQMFEDPLRFGRLQVERAAKDAPALVVGVDFLFWFGYGYVGFHEAADGVRVEVPQERLALQAKGLALLERLSCPLIVGDYPDMTGADRRMLNELQIPDRDTLAKLNENLRQWAEKRGNVHVFPLSEFVAGAKQRGLPVSLDGREVLLPPQALLQSDMLHATVLGMGVLTQRLAAAIPELVPDGSPLVPAVPEFAVLVRKLGGESQLEHALELLQQTTAAPATTGAGGAKQAGG